MILCKHCGARVVGNACFCGICGWITEDTDDEPTCLSTWNSPHAPHAASYISTNSEDEHKQTGFATQPIPTETLPTTGTGQNGAKEGSQHAPETRILAHINAQSRRHIRGYIKIHHKQWLPAILVLLLLSVGIGSQDSGMSAPKLALNGRSTTIAQGDILQLHGYNFLPGTGIKLMLDDTYTLHIAQQSSSDEHRYDGTFTATVAAPTSQAGQTATTAGDGTFIANIPVGSNWRAGRHTITASEMPGWRSASASFTIISTKQGHGQPARTSTHVGPAQSTASPSSTEATFSSISPNVVTLGPTEENSSQIVSSQITLNTTGTGTVSWNASWDQTQAPWLQLDQLSGNIQAPISQAITLRAQPSGLKAGNYSTIVTFTALPDQRTLTLMVNLAVQSNCISADPVLLNFIGIADASDPQPQAISPLNCTHSSGNWSSTTTTSDGGNWLSISPGSGTLSTGNAPIIIIDVSNLNANLLAGLYQGTIIFSTASAQVTVHITLTVQAPLPKLTISPDVLDVGSNCLYNGLAGWTCIAFLSSKDAQTNLSWSANSPLIVQPAQGILPPGITTTVVIAVPATCSTSTSITFTGPDNTATLVLNCT